MRRPDLLRTVTTVFLAVAATLAIAQQRVPQHLFFHVALSAEFQHPVSGRLLLFVSPGHGDKTVDVNMMSPTKIYIAAKEIVSLKPGQTIDIDADGISFPAPLSQATQGDYQAQAVLDVAHTYNYSGRQPGDIISPVVDLQAWNPLTGPTPGLTLSSAIPQSPDPLANEPEVNAALRPVDFISPILTQFWGRDIHMKAWVLLPPNYSTHPHDHYPTVYFTHGFGGNLASMRARNAPVFYRRMKSGKMPPMIWVLLDQSSPTGTHEFADGANNGPWGKALTTELIPWLEAHYRMDARTSGRFLQGHSSGGWATLWLQTTYPKIFGGSWSTSPDPSDFHAFSTIDLYDSDANMYRRPDGSPQPIIRMHTTVLATMEQLAHMESVLGDYGGQLASFEWVFSPRGPDGRPLPMFNRQTGAVDPDVVAYWRDHYDISHHIETNWKMLKPDLRGKIHLYVGTDDTFYLDGAAHRLQSLLENLDGEGHFTFIPSRTHFDLYGRDGDKDALFDQIAAQMYAIARPRR